MCIRNKCFYRALQFTKHFAHTSPEFGVVLHDSRGWIGWAPVISLALRLLDLNLHTSNFNWHSCCPVLLRCLSSHIVCCWLQLFFFTFTIFPSLFLSSLSFSSLKTRAYVAIFIYFCSMLVFAFY